MTMSRNCDVGICLVSCPLSNSQTKSNSKARYILFWVKPTWELIS